MAEIMQVHSNIGFDKGGQRVFQILAVPQAASNIFRRDITRRNTYRQKSAAAFQGESRQVHLARVDLHEHALVLYSEKRQLLQR